MYKCWITFEWRAIGRENGGNGKVSRNETKKQTTHKPSFNPEADTPVTAMLAGRGLRCAGTDRRYTTPDAVVELDRALPGRDVFKLVGVISPERRPAGWFIGPEESAPIHHSHGMFWTGCREDDGRTKNHTHTHTTQSRTITRLSTIANGKPTNRNGTGHERDGISRIRGHFTCDCVVAQCIRTVPRVVCGVKEKAWNNGGGNNRER